MRCGADGFAVALLLRARQVNARGWRGTVLAFWLRVRTAPALSALSSMVWMNVYGVTAASDAAAFTLSPAAGPPAGCLRYRCSPSLIVILRI